MRDLNLEWNTSYSAKTADVQNSTDKQPFKIQFRTACEYLYEDIDRHIALAEQDVEPHFSGIPNEEELATDPVLVGADSLINACLRAKFLKLST